MDNIDKTDAISLRDIKLSFNDHCCLDIPTLTVKQGDAVLLFGENGAGKSTLFKVIAGLATPDNGEVNVLGHQMHRMTTTEKDHFRANHVGIIYQGLNLIPYMTALQNILLPCGFSARKKAIVSEELSPEYDAYMLMAQLNLEDPARLQHKTNQLSRGLQQRVAIARALIGRPQLILADEPASTMGSYSQKVVYQFLVNHAKAINATLVCISHSKEANAFFGTHINMKDINKNAESNPLW